MSAPTIDHGRLRQVTLEVLNEETRNGRESATITRVITQAASAYAPPQSIRQATHEAALACVNELIRSGMLGLGQIEGGTWSTDTCYLTETGKAALTQLSRDPINPRGYLAYLDAEATLDQTTRSYVEEALKTYCACCYKATAILLGAAVENLVLELRDAVADGLTQRGTTAPRGLSAWQMRIVLEAIADQLLPDLVHTARESADQQVTKMREDVESRLQPIAAEFRRLRNHAGHPASLEPLGQADAHANLLLFPSTAKLLIGLRQWVRTHYA